MRCTGTRSRFAGFAKPTYTIVPDELFDELLADLSGAELKVLLYIIRRTFGFKKDRDAISFTQFLTGITTRDGRQLDRGCGVKSRSHLCTALKRLEALGAIVAEKCRDAKDEPQTTVYRLHLRQEGVVPKSHPPSAQIALPLVPKSNPHQTERQDTGEQQLGGGVAQTTDNRSTEEVAPEALPTEALAVPAGLPEQLHRFGISPRVACQLVATYPASHILTKLTYVQWLLDQHSPLVGKNPAGFLRRAIEQDYATPRACQERPDSQEALPVTEPGEESAPDQPQDESTVAVTREHDATADELAAQYPAQPIPGTTLTTTDTWRSTLDALKTQVTGPIFRMWLNDTILAHCDDAHAVVVTPSQYHAEELARRLHPVISHTLATIVGKPLQCEYVFPGARSHRHAQHQHELVAVG